MNPGNSMGGFRFRLFAAVIVAAFTLTAQAQNARTELVFASAEERDQYLDYVLNHIPSLPADSNVEGDCGSSAPDGVEIEQCKRITLGETPIRWDGDLSVKQEIGDTGEYSFYDIPLSVTIEPVSYYTAQFRGENWLIREVIYTANPHASNILPTTKKLSCPMIKGVDIKAPLQDPFLHESGGSVLNVLVGFKTQDGVAMGALQNHRDYRKPTFIYDGDHIVDIRGCPSLDYNPLTPTDLTFVELQVNLEAFHADKGLLTFEKHEMDKFVFNGLTTLTRRYPHLNRTIRPVVESSSADPNYGLDVITFTNMFSMGYDRSKGKFSSFNRCSHETFYGGGGSGRILGGTLNSGGTYGRVYWANEDGQINSCSGRIHGTGFANFRNYMNESFCPHGEAIPTALDAFCMNVDTRRSPWN